MAANDAARGLATLRGMELTSGGTHERALPAARKPKTMPRIFKRLVTLFVSALLTGASIAACASEEPTYDSKAFSNGGCTEEFCKVSAIPGATLCCIAGPNPCGVDMSDGKGCVPKCDKKFCPTGVGNPCCVPLTNSCGLDNGMGCVLSTVDAG